jgi:hypothetical protein
MLGEQGADKLTMDGLFDGTADTIRNGCCTHGREIGAVRGYGWG